MNHEAADQYGSADDPSKNTALRCGALFVGLALGFSVIYWALVSLAKRGSLPFAMGPLDVSLANHSPVGASLSMLLRVFGPGIAAIIALYYFYGSAGLRQLWRSATRWRSPAWLYALAFMGPLIASGIVVGIAYPLNLIRLAPDGVHPLRFVVLLPLMLVFDGPLGEEIGWRGLLLPQLLKRMSPIGASLVVGVIWFAWHIPLYLADGRDFSAVGYFINVLALSLIFTWFYLKSRYSTFMAILLHATTNFALFLVIKSFSIVNTTTLSYIHDAVLVAVAAFVVAYFLRLRAGGLASNRGVDAPAISPGQGR